MQIEQTLKLESVKASSQDFTDHWALADKHGQAAAQEKDQYSPIASAHRSAAGAHLDAADRLAAYRSSKSKADAATAHVEMLKKRPKI